MSDPQLNSDGESKSRLARFWANGGVFSIIAICFFLLSFANVSFLAPGIVFMVLSLIWTARDQRSRPKSRRLGDPEDPTSRD